MTDVILFGVLFATFAVLRNSTYGGPSGQDIFELPFILVETIILLISSFTAGMAVLAAKSHHRLGTLIGFGLTFILGAAFLIMEFSEFAHLIQEGFSWRASAFLSSFFTLVGTHGAHIAAGLLWMIFMFIQIFVKGMNESTVRRLTMLGMFWHFLDVVWIFIFTIVYLMGII